MSNSSPYRPRATINVISSACSPWLNPCTWLPMAARGLDETFFPKLVVFVRRSFRDPVGINHQNISRCQFKFGDRAVPLFEQTQYGRCGGDPCHAPIGSRQ